MFLPKNISLGLLTSESFFYAFLYRLYERRSSARTEVECVCAQRALQRQTVKKKKERK
jgi:hypothetical protein